jgi:hypothetical protein
LPDLPEWQIPEGLRYYSSELPVLQNFSKRISSR